MMVLQLRRSSKISPVTRLRMVPYNLKLALRHLSRNKLFTIINIAGLSIGLACCILLILHVSFELGFDRFHNNRSRLFRVTSQSSSLTPYPMAPAIKEVLPRVADYCRIIQYDNIPAYVIHENNPAAEKGLMYADSSFFKIFSFKLLSGNKNQILRNPDKIIMSNSMALKYFGSTDIIGKTVCIKQFEKNVYTIEGIFEDLPLNSTIQASIIGSTLYLEKIWGSYMMHSWGDTNCKTYLLLDNKEAANDMNKRITSLFQLNYDEEEAKEEEFSLQPVTRMHLFSSGLDSFMGSTSEIRGSIVKVRIFSTIAILILLIAFVNYITLSTAQSFSRLKEFGIRKVFGSSLKNLIKNIAFEFLIIYLVSILLAFLLIGFLKPVFANSFSFRMPSDPGHSLGLISAFVILALLAGFLASTYITWFITRHHPMDVLKNKLVSGKIKNASRGMLVIFQFFILTILVICSMVIVKQNSLLYNKDLGFDKQSLLVVSMPPMSRSNFKNIARDYRLLVNRFNEIPGIVNISGATYLPPEVQVKNYNYKKHGSDEFKELETISSDFNLIETMGIKLSSGRVFSNKYSSDSASNIIINELAAKRLGLTDPVGESVIMEDNNGHVYNKTIIGVVKDFHMRSLYDDIEPMAMIHSLDEIRKVVMRIAPESSEKSLKEVKAVFAKLFPEEPFEYTFMEEGLKAKYISETRLQYVVMFFSILAICISISGLLGLAIFTTQKRTREIGLRKVNGAVTFQIITMLNAGYFKWIAIAFILACPIAYYAMNKWLQDFAFKTGLSWWLFLAAGAVTSIIALITVTSLSWKTATRNPAESMRYE